MKVIKLMKELSWGTQVQGQMDIPVSDDSVEFQGSAKELLSDMDFTMEYGDRNIKTIKLLSEYKSVHSGDIVSAPILHIILK